MTLSKPLRLGLVVVSTLCLALAVAALAKDEKADPKGAAPGAPTAADLEAYVKAGRPGEHHAHLQQMVGTFDVEMEITMAPGAPPQKSKGVQKSQMLLDGRFLHADYTGEMMGMPFRGMSLMGYDNQKKKYFNAWVDSMSTGLVVFEGTCADDGKTFTFTGEYDDAMTGKHQKVRHVTRLVSPDKYTFEWFETADGGKEQKTMSATYTRAKG
jgi:hypothetical protein